MEHSSGCEQQPSPKARETRPHDENHEGASFALYAGISRGGTGRAVAASLGVFTGGSPGHPHWPTGWAESLPHHSALGLSAGGCRVKTGSGPLERSLPPGSGVLGRGRTGANSDPWVMTANGATGVVRIIRLGMRSPHGIPRGRGVELRATMRRARGPRA